MTLSKIKAAAVVLVLGAGLATLPAATAHAAPGCWASGGKWWCNNTYAAPVYRWEGVDGTTQKVVGYMYSTTSWFTGYSDCQSYPNGEGAPHPYRWVKTQADNGQWGWMNDKDISNETNTLPKLQPCGM